MKSFEAKNIRKRFGGVIALRGADIKFEGAKICGLVGANGSGKTTFARICAGLVRADNEEFCIDNKNASINNPDDAEKYGIVLVHQNLSLIPDLTVWENINLGHEKRKRKVFLDNRDAKKVAQEILEDLVPGEISIDEKIVDLNPAQKQLVEIAKALYQEPKLLILDEPTAALEYSHAERLFKKIKELKNSGVSVIFISHRLWEINRICDLVFAFRNGITAGFLDYNKDKRDEKLIIPLVTGSKAGEIDFIKKSKRDLKHAEFSLVIENISFDNKVKNISFKVKKGEVLGIGGLHNQGQEELMMILAGAFRSKSGKIILNGKEMKLRQPTNAIKNGIYSVPGDRAKSGLFMNHNVFKNIIYPRFTLRKDRFFLNFQRLASLTDKIIKKADLVPPNRNMLVQNLSGGNQQKVVFGRWLQFSPNLLLLNDPAKGIDIQAMHYLYKLVHELSEKGTTVILYASSNEELINNCDRVKIMFEGEIVEEIEHEDISDEKLVRSSLRIGADSDDNNK